MHLEGTTIGALSVYADQPRPWSDEELTTAQLLADMTTAYIVMVDQLRSAGQALHGVRAARLTDRNRLYDRRGARTRSGRTGVAHGSASPAG